MNRLSGHVGRRAVHTHRYEKQAPGHHVPVDRTFLTLVTKREKRVRRLQHNAIDGATHIRALEVYTRHTQQNAVDFLGDVVEKFPFRVQRVRTDRGHEFQASAHRHLADRGIEHAHEIVGSYASVRPRAGKLKNQDGTVAPRPRCGWLGREKFPRGKFGS